MTTPLSPILAKLSGGDLRSIGLANEVAAEIEHNPALFTEVFEGLFHDDARIRMRAADALAKAATRNPTLIQPYKARLIGEVALSSQQEVQWHLAELLGLLELDSAEQKAVVELLLGYTVNTRSNIVRVNAMQTLADIALRDRTLRPMVTAKLEALVENGTPSVKVRGGKLLKLLKK